METKLKKKLCWHCEGEVLLNATHCPFCGVSLETPAMSSRPIEEPPAPPYQMGMSQKERLVPLSPHLEKESVWKRPLPAILSFVLLLMGTSFAVFGVTLYLFANESGFLNLHWDSQYWFVYLMLSFPMLFFAWRTVQNGSEDEE